MGVVYCLSSFLEDGFEFGVCVASVNEVAEEGLCGVYVVLPVTVLGPKALYVAIDKAFQDTRWVC